MDRKLIDAISSTSRTGLITLYAHGLESKSKDPILRDPFAEHMTEKLNPDFLESDDRFLRSLALGKLRKQLVTHIALRAKKYDDYAYDFIRLNPEGTIINLGCGLDSRYQRLPMKPKLFIDLDLPEMMAIKKELVEENDHYRLIGQSIFDDNWFQEVAKLPGPKFFMAEGLFMYLDAKLLRDWLIKLAEQCPGSYLLFEVVTEKYTRGLNKKMVEFKFRKQYGVKGDVSYNFGIKSSRDLEELHHKFEFIEEWTCFDEHHPKMGLMNLMGYVRSLKYVQWTVFYKVKE